MTEKKVRIGFDRFIAREWADYALELFLSSEKEDENYQLLKAFLQREITGVESARKTSNQLKRLWLNNQDGKKELRIGSGQILKTKQINNQSIFHLGMAINVFPIFQEVCRRLGYLSKVQPEVSKNTLIERVAQTFLNPSSIPRTVSRVIQTLENWGFIEIKNGVIRLKDVMINDQETCVWFVEALVLANLETKVSLNVGDSIPEKLGVQLPSIRNFIQQSKNLAIYRNMDREEVILIKNSQ